MSIIIFLFYLIEMPFLLVAQIGGAEELIPEEYIASYAVALIVFGWVVTSNFWVWTINLIWGRK